MTQFCENQFWFIWYNLSGVCISVWTAFLSLKAFMSVVLIASSCSKIQRIKTKNIWSCEDMSNEVAL
jgi:uncharacterized protein YcgI (DUF1989 family)